MAPLGELRGMIAIIDYGLGNVAAIANIYKRLNIEAYLATTAAELERASRLILPGVGSFDWAMRLLDRSGLRESIDSAVMVDHKPILGICVGMQMMAERSAEGVEPGLGWIPASVERLPALPGLMLPHMGWNDVSPRGDTALFQGLSNDARFYFLHSYYVAPRDETIVTATVDYGSPFVCAVRSRNVFGAQFHPEKSHGWGIRLLKNFAEV
jgi:glutamine amidotransferase